MFTEHVTQLRNFLGTLPQEPTAVWGSLALLDDATAADLWVTLEFMWLKLDVDSNTLSALLQPLMDLYPRPKGAPDVWQ